MIAVDASVVIGWLNGFDHPATDRLGTLLDTGQAFIAPAALTEIYSDPELDVVAEAVLARFRVLEIQDGYWRRTGLLRSAAFQRGRKAAMADALIAQASIDAKLPLLTRDRDFNVFAEVGGLTLA